MNAPDTHATIEAIWRIEQAKIIAGLARMVYWPDEEGGFFWVVESKNAKGWKRFVTHNYRPA